MAQYFNSKVSIITKSEIRYEGTIYQINPQQQTIALKDVRSFGTEGRRPDHEIPPNQQSYDILVFKAAEIKDFIQQDQKKPEEKKQENIQQDNQPPQLQTQNTDDQQQQAQLGQNQNNFQQNQQPKQIGSNPRAFDFDQMIEKTSEIEKIKKQDMKPKYNPTSFFDSLSTSTQKQDKNQQPRNQNQIDTDTFGNFYKQKQHQNNNNNNNNNGQKRNNQNNHYKNNNNNNNNNYRKKNDQQRVVYIEKQPQEQQQQQQQ